MSSSPDDRQSGSTLAGARVEGDAFDSLTPACPQVHLFEREIAEQFGVRARGHPWLKPVRFHRSYRRGHDACGPAARRPIVGVTDFYRVEGDEVHEVAVGPVHAGVIEPGHFRFQCHGEQVFHLEISLGYQHRGVERALVGGPDQALHPLRRDAGRRHDHRPRDRLLPGARGARRAARSRRAAQALRGIALELERLANHVGDLGALAGDVGFLPTASYCGRIRGDFLNMTALALRQPLRPRPDPPGRRRASTSTTPRVADLLRAPRRRRARHRRTPSSCSGTRRR